jgi:Holliday junction resolvase
LPKKKSQYSYGRKGEKKIARKLRKKGYEVEVSSGSRGATDIRARKGSRKYNIQVKRTRKGQSSSVSANDVRRLKISASRQKAIPVVADIIRGKITFRSARSKRKISP